MSANKQITLLFVYQYLPIPTFPSMQNVLPHLPQLQQINHLLSTLCKTPQVIRFAYIANLYIQLYPVSSVHVTVWYAALAELALDPYMVLHVQFKAHPLSLAKSSSRASARQQSPTRGRNPLMNQTLSSSATPARISACATLLWSLPLQPKRCSMQALLAHQSIMKTIDKWWGWIPPQFSRLIICFRIVDS